MLRILYLCATNWLFLEMKLVYVVLSYTNPSIFALLVSNLIALAPKM